METVVWKSVGKRRRVIVTTTETLTPHIPQDIIIDILLRVPVKALLRFKCVCMSWYKLLKDSCFIRMHLDRSTQSRNPTFMIPRLNNIWLFDFHHPSSPLFTSTDFLEVDYPLQPNNNFSSHLCSCDGILLIGLSDKSMINWSPFEQKYIGNFPYSALCLWNPSTKEFKKLPDTLVQFCDHRPQCYHIAFGFGYDSTNDDYKVIRILNYYDGKDGPLLKRVDEFSADVHVYSMNNNLCKKIQDIPYFISSLNQFSYISCGLYVNGAIHWRGKRTPITDGYCSFPIVSFDCSSEEYKEVAMPAFFNSSNLRKIKFGVLEGGLCLYHLFDDRHVDVYLMKEYGVKESWTKAFSIGGDLFKDYGLPAQYRAVCIANNGDVVLQRWPDSSNLILFAPQEKLLYLCMQGVPAPLPKHACVETFIRSLVSLKSNKF